MSVFSEIVDELLAEVTRERGGLPALAERLKRAEGRRFRIDRDGPDADEPEDDR